MIPKKILVLFSLMLFLGISCKEEKKERVASPTPQMKEVMAIHDEVMPKMGSFGKLVGQLSTKEDSTAMGLKYKQARVGLQEARKTMMDWMQGFNNKFVFEEIHEGKALSATKQQWLDEEEVKIKALRDQINTSLENAEALLISE